LELTGFVLNDSEGVAIEVEGPIEGVREFARRLRADPPALAVIETIEEQALPVAGAQSFVRTCMFVGGKRLYSSVAVITLSSESSSTSTLDPAMSSSTS
jgi:hydrogenase maturation protein HypF